MTTSDLEIHDQLERLRKIAVEALQQRGLTPGPHVVLEQSVISICGGEYVIRLKLVNTTATPPLEIMLIRGTAKPLECLVPDSSDSKLIQDRILAMLDPLLREAESGRL
jgi:hypothetical protein